MSAKARTILWGVFIILFFGIGSWSDPSAGPSFWGENVGFLEGIAVIALLVTFLTLATYCPIMQAIVLVLLAVAVADRMNERKKHS
jgi:hypothetical protein